jgi:putative membrane-bound dehydrogenase-like protein
MRCGRFIKHAFAGLILCTTTITLWHSAELAAEPAAEIKDSLDTDYADQLPRTPPTSPADALKTFEVQPGFTLDQVASEPLVTDPVAMSFDEDGHLFVAEMGGYSEDPDKFVGCIRQLIDTDNDGHYDKSTVYVDKLAWPTAVACYDGGVFVGVVPDILYCKDTDGDGQADIRKVVFTGFNSGNVQGLLNSFHWGLDNRLHGSSSTIGATVTSPADPQMKPLVLRGRDFAIEPRTMTMTATSGGGQHGMSFDRWGNKYVCSNSDHAQVILYEDRYVARNPYLAAPPARKSIAADGPQAEVFRISPIEPWRIVRTRLRVKGIVKGIVEGGGRPAGYFTGATGIVSYTGNAYPAAYRDNLFVSDAGGNLVHRKTVETDGIGFIARRADPGREFLASRDLWFRSVQHANAPDGTLYIADMCREVIEHPASLPPIIKKHLDLTSGRDRGRIYRMLPEGFNQPAQPHLSDATTAELVALLDHPNGWHRNTALRLLYERNDRQAVPALEKLSAEAKLPEGRIHALAALDGLHAIRAEVILPRLSDEHPRVREHAVRISEAVVAGAPTVRAKLYEMVSDADPRVRFQLAFTLGEFGGRARNAALAALAKLDAGDVYMRAAIISSLFEGVGEVFSDLAADKDFRATGAGSLFLSQLAKQIGAQNRPSDVALLLKTLPTLLESDSNLSQAIIRNVTEGAGTKHPALAAQLASATGGKSQALLERLVADSIAKAADETLDATLRAEATRSLGIGKYDRVGETLLELVDYRQPQQVQIAALSTLGQFSDPEIAEALLDHFEQLSPRLRNEALETIFSRPRWLAELISAVEKGDFSAANVDAARAKVLLSHPDEKIRAQAEKLFSASKPSRRQDVIDAYRPALALQGNAERGRTVFRKTCAACHKLEGFGNEIGLNLQTIRNRGPETILLSVLDPNREVDAKYLSYLALDTEGRTYTGIIAEENATSVTLKRAENATDTLLRIDLEALKSTGQSIMPEGLEKQLDQQALADVIAYLMSLE